MHIISGKTWLPWHGETRCRTNLDPVDEHLHLRFASCNTIWSSALNKCDLRGKKCIHCKHSIHSGRLFILNNKIFDINLQHTCNWMGVAMPEIYYSTRVGSNEPGSVMWLVTRLLTPPQMASIFARTILNGLQWMKMFAYWIKFLVFFHFRAGEKLFPQPIMT